MDTKLFARVAAIGLAAVAITLGVIQMREDRPAAPDRRALDAEAAAVDPLRVQLRRCQALGIEAASDRVCLRAWAENRRRFLGDGARSVRSPAASNDALNEGAVAEQAAAHGNSTPEDDAGLKQHERAIEAAH